MAEAREGGGKSELLAGIRVVADLSGADLTTREGVVVLEASRGLGPDGGAIPAGGPGVMLVGRPSPFAVAPTARPGDAPEIPPTIEHALVIDPGTRIARLGDARTPALVRGVSTIVQQAGTAAEPYPQRQAPLSQILRIVGTRLAFLADHDREEGGGGWLAWGDEITTRLADFWAPLFVRAGGGVGTRTGMRADALIQIPGNGGTGLPLGLDVGPPEAGGATADLGGESITIESGGGIGLDGLRDPGTITQLTRRRRRYIGWHTSEDGKHWRPTVEVDEIVPESEEPPGGGGGGKGDKGDKGDKGESGKGGGDQRKGSDAPDDYDGLGTDEEADKYRRGPRDANDGELTACDEEEPPTTPPGGKGGAVVERPGRDGPWHIPPIPPGGWKKFEEEYRRLEEERRKAAEAERERQRNPDPAKGGGATPEGLTPSGTPDPADPDPFDELFREAQAEPAPPGSRAARASYGAGRTKIRPREPAGLYEGDVRRHLGGGIWAPPALVPPGGIRLVTARDFALGHTTWDVATFIVDKVNQVISLLNERFPFAPDAVTGAGLRVPVQGRARVEKHLPLYQEGTLVSLRTRYPGARSRQALPVPHLVARDVQGRKVLAPISPDRAPERTLGTGEQGAHAVVRFATARPAHRDRGRWEDGQPKLGWNGQTGRLEIAGAVETAIRTDLSLVEPDGTTVSVGEPTATANAVPRAGSDGKLDAGWIPSLADQGAALKGIRFSNGTFLRSFSVADATLNDLALLVYTACYDLETTGSLDDIAVEDDVGTFSFSSTTVTLAELADFVGTAINQYKFYGYLPAVDYTITNRRTRFKFDCTAFTLGQLADVVAAMLTTMGV